MPRADCKTCSSPHRSEYERLRKEGKSLKDLSRYAREKYNELISSMAFSRHFNSKHGRAEQRKVYVPQKLKPRDCGIWVGGLDTPEDEKLKRFNRIFGNNTKNVTDN